MKFYIKANISNTFIERDRMFRNRPHLSVQMVDIAIVAANGNAYVGTVKPWIGDFQQELRHIIHGIVDFFKFHSDGEEIQLVYFDGCDESCFLKRAFRKYSNFDFPSVHIDLLQSAYEFSLANAEQMNKSKLFRVFSPDGKVTWQNFREILSSADDYPVLDRNPSSKDFAFWMPKLQEFINGLSVALALEGLPDETEADRNT